jgi:hypothetical protein
MGKIKMGVQIVPIAVHSKLKMGDEIVGVQIVTPKL